MIDELSYKIKNKFSKNDLNNFGEFISQSAFISNAIDINSIISVDSDTTASDYFDLNNDYLKIIMSYYRDINLKKIAELYNVIISLLK